MRFPFPAWRGKSEKRIVSDKNHFGQKLNQTRKSNCELENKFHRP